MALDEKEFTLHCACLSGSVEVVERILVETNGSMINLVNNKGLQPLHAAVQRQVSDVRAILELLFRYHVDVNACTAVGGDTALHIVTRLTELESAEELVVLLLEHGANPAIRNDRLRSPYDEALQRGYVDLARVLAGEVTLIEANKHAEETKGRYQSKKLIAAVIEGNMDVIKRTAKTADVNFINEFGAGAIHYAVVRCPSNKLEVFYVLKAAGADVNLVDHEGDTALNLVIKTESLQKGGEMHLLASKLLEWGADTSLKDLDGRDATSIAENQGYNDIQRLLREGSGTDGPVSSINDDRSETGSDDVETTGDEGTATQANDDDTQSEAATKINDDETQSEAATKINDDETQSEAATQINDDETQSEAATQINDDETQSEAATQINDDETQSEAASQ